MGGGDGGGGESEDIEKSEKHNQGDQGRAKTKEHIAIKTPGQHVSRETPHLNPRAPHENRRGAQHLKTSGPASGRSIWGREESWPHEKSPRQQPRWPK